MAQLAQSLLRELVAPPDHAVIARRHSEHKEIRDFYLQGRYHWKLATPDSIRNSVACFSQRRGCSTQITPPDGRPSAKSLLVSSMFGFLAPQDAGDRMKEAALKAIAINPLLPEAHVALGSVLSLLDWNWAAGEQELEKSIQLGPSRRLLGTSPMAFTWPAANSSKPRWPKWSGRWNLIRHRCFRISFWDGCMESPAASMKPVSQHMLVSQLAPDYGLPYFGLGLAYAGKGMFDDAIAHFTNANPLKCRSLLRGQLGYCYAMAGRPRGSAAGNQRA